MFADQATRYKHRVYCRFLDDGVETHVETYEQAWRRACRWAALLRDRGLQRGDRVIIALPNCADFVGAFFGTLLAGGTPAAVAPFRRQTADEENTAVLAHRLRSTGGRLLVLPRELVHDVTRRLSSEVPGLAVVSADDAAGVHPSAEAPAEESDLALLQFTSGTSERSRAVMLTQAAVLEQIEALTQTLEIVDPDADSAVSWLPLFHDMGLIGFLLTPVALGGEVTLLKPEDFIRRPRLWLWAISHYGATITAGPSSSYQWCADRIRPNGSDTLDLSRLRIALVGAETVRDTSLEKFCARFERCGFRRTSLIPTYGLAENCLAVTMPRLGEGPRFDVVDLATLEREHRAVPPAAPDATRRTIACVGTPLENTTVAILDDDGRRLPDRDVGEIALLGRCVMAGYYDQPEATRETMRDGWLRTGDLGYLAEGELFVTGRKKEVMIVAGRNYYPDDLERVAAAVPGVRQSEVVVVSVPDERSGTEVIAVYAETHLATTPEREALMLALRQALTRAGYPVHEVVLLRPYSIPRTRNGKIRRVAFKDQVSSRERSR